MMSQGNDPLQEWAPLTTLLEKIPTTFKIGLFNKELNFTCIDVIAEFIAVGTNHGVVYWFDRKTEEIETFGCQDNNSIITCVQVISTVDYMVAAGNNRGVVTIFQVPKRLCDFLPETWKPKKKKQVERFNIGGLHQVSVTSVEWSKNGMNLFSGDQNGLVVLTKIDFDMHLSKSTKLLNESYSVIQLSYRNGLLLISTLFRTIIVDTNHDNQITQVGCSERKLFGKFGAIFAQNKNYTQEPIIYASRPGLRIWQVDKKGTVLKTLILKETINLDQAQVKLLNPASNNTGRKIQGNQTFGIIMTFSNDLLVTYNDDEIYFINPSINNITSIITDLRKVTDIACCGDEIFILEGERNILRVSYYPEDISAVNDRLMNQLKSEFQNPINLSLEHFKAKWKLAPIIPALPIDDVQQTNAGHSKSISVPVTIGVDTTSIVSADEALEMLTAVSNKSDNSLVSGIDLINNQINNFIEDTTFLMDRRDIFKKIGEQEFEDIIFTPRRKNDLLGNRTVAAVEASLAEEIATENNDISINIDEDALNNKLIAPRTSLQSRQSIDSESSLMFKNNLESIRQSIQDKEKLLFNYLDLDLSVLMKESSNRNKKCNFSSSIEINQYINNFSNSNIKERNCKSLISEPSDQNAADRRCNFIEFKDCEYNVKSLKTKPCNKSDLKNQKISETQFNELSKEFVKTSMHQDDDWILLG